MNILILSWRDPQHPLAGGAERITQKYAEYWIKSGHQIWWMSASFPGGSPEETVDKIQYIRITPRLSHLAWLNLVLYPIYLLHSIFKAWRLIQTAKIDKVIDEIHGLPFFTPLFAADKSVLLVCEVAGPIWDKMFKFPINKIGKLAELITYFLYRNSEIWAISQNTKKDILSILPTSTIKILPLGIEVSGQRPKLKKNNFPSAVFVARLVKMKGIEAALEAAEIIKKELPDFKLFIIGKGTPEYEKYLSDSVRDKDLEENVQFLGYVSEQKKFEIMAQCHFLIHPSYKEGFGLTVLESGLMKTPAIVRKGSSLDELVTDSKDGFLIENNQQIADCFIKAYLSKQGTELGKKAEEKSLRYEWTEVLSQSKKITGI